MRKHTTCEQRRAFYREHLRGKTYRELAERHSVSKECVRFWCRRQRDGSSCHSQYHREPSGLLSHFDPLVRYWVLRLRLKHPRWGPGRILARLRKIPSLRYRKLPSEASIGRYLHQWPRFRRRSKAKRDHPRPTQPTAVHQRWQIDFKEDISLHDEAQAILHTVYDPVGEACLEARVFPTEQVTVRQSRANLDEVRLTLRACFARWGTLPDEIQTDGDPALVAQPGDSFPSLFTLWLKGLSVEHLVTRPGKPTDNAEVERAHRTVNDYAIVGNEDCSVEELQSILGDAVSELVFELPSRAKGCGGRPPAEAHPELLTPRRPFLPEHELAVFDLSRVDAYLATFTWQRKVSKTGQICLGGHHKYYSVGRVCARQHVLVRFDPSDRHFVFFAPDNPEREIGRRPARNLAVADITGLATWPAGLGPQQLPLPLAVTEGVNC